MSKFNLDQKIGDIVVQFPKSKDVFKKHKLDFCCGGDKILKDVIKKENLDEFQIINEVNNLYDQFKDNNKDDMNFLEMPLNVLADYIVNVHHAYLYTNLPKISGLTKTILRVHGSNHPELSKVYKLFNTLAMELEEHLISEETTQYPAIHEFVKTKDRNALIKACDIIEELQNEHEGAGNIIKELRQITNEFTTPNDACGTYIKTFEMIEELESDLFQHIHLENNILFPRLFALREKL